MILSHLKDHDEDYVVSCPGGCPVDETAYPGGLCYCGERLEGHFTCGGCGERRNADEGGHDGSVLSRACDHCVVKVWSAMEATAIAIREGRDHG